jgi:hypothetical protein
LRQVEAANCDKFVAGFCRSLLLGFEPHYFLTKLVGDGVFQNQGFQVSESRQKLRSTEKITSCVTWRAVRTLQKAHPNCNIKPIAVVPES